MGSRRQQRDARRQAFLDAFRLTGNVSAAAEAVPDLNRATVYRNWLKDPEFKEAFEDAEQEATDALEREARRRAMEGCREPVYQGGELVGHRLVYSDALMALMLKAHRPEKYRERSSLELSGPAGGPVRVAAEVRPEFVAEVTRLLERADPPALAGGDEPVHPV